MNSSDKISALINLLDDPDEVVFQQVCEELIQIGPSVIPDLESAWESSFNAILQQRIERILHQIQFLTVKAELSTWSNLENPKLIDAALIIANYQYPDLDKQDCLDFIEKLTKDIWLEVNDDMTAMEKVNIMNKVFFDQIGFSGNKKNFHSSRNCFINNVIETKKGSPISLSLLYIEVAERLKIPIYGVNLAEHFVLAYTQIPIDFIEEVSKEDILFYINPFNKGTIFQYDDILQFIKQLKLDSQDKFFLPCSKIDVIRRLLNNLIFSFSKSGEEDKIEELKELLKGLG